MTDKVHSDHNYKYLIIGGGMTADAAVHGIRELDAAGSIGIIASEPDAPYSRPPLSKALWKGDPLESVWRGTDKVSGVELHLGRHATKIDADARRVTDDQGNSYGYEKLLLATGAKPRRLPFGGDGIIYYRTLADFRKLQGLAKKGASVAVLGGGFIGSEVAAALALQGSKVVQLFPEDGMSARIFPAPLARHLVGYYREHGVDVKTGQKVAGIKELDSGYEVTTVDGNSYKVDAVVAGLGVIPDTGLASDAGLAVDDGILVNEHLETSHAGIWAAGDVARFKPHGHDGRGFRVEHEDNALSQGRAAGRAMAGDGASYTHVPFFYSDLFDMGYEAVGDLDARGDTYIDWKDEFKEGVIYYLSNNRVKGVLLWNVWGQVDAARALLDEPGTHSAANLKGRLGSE